MTHPPVPLTSRRRVFTIDEEALMLRQSHGEFTMHQLEQELHAARDTIISRMRVLGLEPNNSGHRLPRGANIGAPQFGDGHDSCPSVGKDRLLQRLVERHGGRSY